MIFLRSGLRWLISLQAFRFSRSSPGPRLLALSPAAVLCLSVLDLPLWEISQEGMSIVRSCWGWGAHKGIRSRGGSLLFEEIFLASLAPTSRTRTYPFFSPEWGLGLSLSPGCPFSMAKMVLSKVRLKEKAPSSYPRLLAISKTLVPMDGSSSISTLQGHSWVVVEVWEERAWWASWELTLMAVHQLSCKLQPISYLYCWHSCTHFPQRILNLKSYVLPISLQKPLKHL